jgi:riboflavin synthase
VFTGLIDSVAALKSVNREKRSISLAVIPDCAQYEVNPGDSVAVNGACLTVESVSGNVLFFTAVYETLSKTTLANAAAGDTVNLERALRPTDRIGGHIVLGHVDGVGQIISDRTVGDSVVRSVRVPEALRRFMAPKGSVALNGVSLTIADARGDTIEVSLIPYTLEATAMKSLRAGDAVNIECDVLARYIARLLEHGGADEPNSGTNLLARLETLGF